MVDGKKMAKSAGNFFTVRDLLGRGYTGREIRLALLGSHYRANTNFTLEGLEAARKTIGYLEEFLRNMGELEGPPPPDGSAAITSLAAEHDARFRAALDDDLNVSAALAQVHGFTGEAYKRSRSRAEGLAAASQVRSWDSVLGVLAAPAGSPGADASVSGAREAGPGDAALAAVGLERQAVEALVAEREAARKRKDFAAADRIRQELQAKGIVIKDTPQGTRWRIEGSAG
jgi:cysteinyl-tRNA synthetase